MMRSITERDYSLDLLKFIAIILVIMLHISTIQSNSDDLFVWNAVNFLESLTRTCVPLFLMVTGSLLCKSKCDFKTIFKRINRVIIPLIFWSFFYVFLYNNLFDENASIFNILERPTSSHLWYLYCLIGIYVTLPILCFIYKAASLTLKLYICILWFISCTLIPSLKSYGYYVSVFFDISTFGLYQGYFLVGAIISDLNKSSRVRLLAFLFFILNTLAIWFLTKFTHDHEGVINLRNHINSSVFVCLASVSLFTAIQGINIKNNIALKFLSSQSNYIFGIYLTHMTFYYLMVKFNAPINHNIYYLIPLSSIAIYFSSLIICLVLSKLKLNRIIM